MNHAARRAWVLAGFLACTAGQASAADPALPVVSLTAGMYRIEAEVAATPQQLQRGLMFRESMPEQRGMLFVFAHSGTQCMWMRNTLIPLSVAFIRDDGSIVNIETMAPKTETSHCSREPVRLALEMNAGWFEKRGLAPGTRIRGLPGGTSGNRLKGSSAPP